MTDLRSDTVTKPGVAMRAAMAQAAVGDDVYGEDPTVRELEERAAELLGKKAGLFFPSGTQSNLAALLSHCRRGDEYIAGDIYHVYRYEAGGAAVLGGISPCPLATGARGELAAQTVAAAVKDDDPHFPRTRLLCMENTVSGTAQDLAETKAAVAAARRRGLLAHLDGARLMNASIAQNIPAKKLAAPFDSVSLCLSKGLGAPAGTVLCGGKEFIGKARRNRKILGGGMRQAGIIAAAGMYALENNIERLHDDHQLAEELAQGLAEIAGTNGATVSLGTNMIFYAPAAADHSPLRHHLKGCGVLVGDGRPAFRMVTHLDVSRKDIAKTVAAFAKYYKSRKRR